MADLMSLPHTPIKIYLLADLIILTLNINTPVFGRTVW
jgi:hypothetical protein